MSKSSGEEKIKAKELNKILPSYLLNEIEQDNIDNNDNEKASINKIYIEKVSYYFLNYISKNNYFYRILIQYLIFFPILIRIFKLKNKSNSIMDRLLKYKIKMFLP